jgi:type VI secretion system protein ImpD
MSQMLMDDRPNKRCCYKTHQIILKLIDHINRMINQLINKIIHTPEMQGLEASWRQLFNLTQECQTFRNKNVKIKILPLKKTTLSEDLLNHSENVDESILFKKVHIDEFDQAGGEPFSVILADYYFHQDDAFNDTHCQIIENLSLIVSTCFCPIIAGCSSKLCDLENWSDIKPYHDYQHLLKKKEWSSWNQLSHKKSSQFVALIAPRLRVRELYQESVYHDRNFFFKEVINQHHDYLWGNPAYRYVSAIVQSFKKTGWFLDIRHPFPPFSCYLAERIKRANNKITQKIRTECFISDKIEKEINALGIMVLREKKIRSLETFHHQTSLYNINKEQDRYHLSIHSHMQYLLCACRIAQTLKIISRNKVGLFDSAIDCETWMQNWLHQFCSAEESPQRLSQLKYPLKHAKVSVKVIEGAPGKFQCDVSISPHTLIEGIDSTLNLSTAVDMNQHQINRDE